jgi:hypothetical protein
VFDIRHDRVHGTAADERRKARQPEEHFTAGHLLLDTATDGDGVFHALWRDRFFVPRKVVWLETPGYDHRLLDVEETVTVDHDGDGGANRGAHCAHGVDARVDRTCDLCGRSRRRRESVERRGLDRGESIRDGAFCGRRKADGRARVGRAVDVRVDRQHASDLPAEQYIGRNIESFA